MLSDDGGLSLMVMLISVLWRVSLSHGEELGEVQRLFGLTKKCLYFCAFARLFSQFYSSTWELNLHRGWFVKPVGLLDRPSAPER